ncbi:MAG: hypothetical protein IKO46_08845 [Salinivirgaceae bacterium]|jgi:hypothetical protein|nr:hypothetical protein [Salinivirgaceae bacterium]
MSTFKKIINICSYSLNCVLIILLTISFFKSRSNNNNDFGIQENVIDNSGEEVENDNKINEYDAKSIVHEIDMQYLNAIKSGIIEREEKDLPLRIQKFKLDDITIDNIVITNDIKPYSGYFETTWYYRKKNFQGGYNSHEKKVYVKVFDIVFNISDNSYSWSSDWNSAYMDNISDLIGYDFD